MLQYSENDLVTTILSSPRRITKGSQFATLFLFTYLLNTAQFKKALLEWRNNCTLRQKTMSTLAGSLQPACMPMPAAELTRSDAVSNIPSGFAVIIRYLFFVLTKNGRHVAETRRPALS